MPRKARIDASGALHYIIARGIDRNTIFQDDFEWEDGEVLRVDLEQYH